MNFNLIIRKMSFLKISAILAVVLGASVSQATPYEKIQEMARCLLSLPELPKGEGFTGPVQIPWEGGEAACLFDGQGNLAIQFEDKVLSLKDEETLKKVEDAMVQAMKKHAANAQERKKRGLVVSKDDRDLFVRNCSQEIITNKDFQVAAKSIVNFASARKPAASEKDSH